MSLAECQSRVDAVEFAEWMAWDELEPIGDEKLVYLVARLCRLFYLANRGERSPDMSVEDFMPWVRREPAAPQTPEEMKRTLAMYVG